MNKHLRVWLVLVLVLAGGVLLTSGHRLMQNQPERQDVTDEALSDRQKAFVDNETDTSTTLFNLAFAALVGLVSLQVSGKRSQRPAGWLPLVAIALLALSLYASFLFRTRVAMAVGRGPLKDLVSPGTDFPLTAQFWLFVTGILTLLFWVFPARAAASVVIAVSISTSATATGQDSPVQGCVRTWMADRHIDLPEATQLRAERLIDAVAHEARVTPTESMRCQFSESLLDELRRRVVADGGADVERPSEALVQAIQLTVDTFDSRNFSWGDAVTRMVTMAQVWNQPSGLLVVRSAQGALFVIVTRTERGPADWKGITNWTVRLPEGTYQLEVLKEGIRTTAPRTITLSNGQRVDFDVPETKK